MKRALLIPALFLAGCSGSTYVPYPVYAPASTGYYADEGCAAPRTRTNYCPPVSIYQNCGYGLYTPSTLRAIYRSSTYPIHPAYGNPYGSDY